MFDRKLRCFQHGNTSGVTPFSGLGKAKKRKKKPKTTKQKLIGKKRIIYLSLIRWAFVVPTSVHFICKKKNKIQIANE